jgi:ABC-type multidrug transport system fused ATPase/permease subunit
VIRSLNRSLALLRPGEKAKYFSLTLSRSATGILDLVGILGVGYLSASAAAFINLGSDPDREIQLAFFTFPAATAQTVVWVALFVFIVFLSKAVISILITLYLAKSLSEYEARSAREIVRISFGRGLSHYNRSSREQVQFAVQEGSPSAFSGILNAFSSIVSESLLFVLIFIAFTIVSPVVALSALLYFGALGYLMSKVFGKSLQKSGERQADSSIRANAAVRDLSELVREATVSRRINWFLDRIYESRRIVARNYAQQYVLMGLPRYLIETSLLLAVAVFVIYQGLSGNVVESAATIGVFLVGGLRLTAALLPLQGAVLQLRQAKPFAEKALEILELAKDPTWDEPPKSKGESKNVGDGPIGVVLKEVCFEYPGRSIPALQDVSLEVFPGAQAALIGDSGSGKSTLADLILGLIMPTSGSVLLNGVSSKANLDYRAQEVSYVPQKPGIIAGSILDNITLGLDSEKVDDSRLQYALAKSSLQSVIENLEGGLNYDLGNNKDSLSGGQLQRIGIARALYSRPKLMILDEATSGLDAESEFEITQAMDSLRGEVTVILIAHRLNTVKKSDPVFLVEEGRIVAFGNFEEILATQPRIANLVRRLSLDSDR